ncbi:MAG: hypothetical protein IPH86_01765 [bacterium]|nr:hypothetical protein [bacterium]
MTRCRFIGGPPRLAPALALVLAAVIGCSRDNSPPLEPPETFNWVAQPVSFSPPPAMWQRQGDNGGGLLGVYFVLKGGGGQVMSLYAHRKLAERDRRAAISDLIARRETLSRDEFLKELSLARARTEDPLSEREAAAAARINASLDEALNEYLADRPGFVATALETALRAAEAYEPTLEEILPHVRLRPERMQEPDRWRIGVERDTVLAGRPAFASDDTLITPERPLLYREVFWVVGGCAFKAVYQGVPENLGTFYRMVDSIRFPGASDAALQ